MISLLVLSPLPPTLFKPICSYQGKVEYNVYIEYIFAQHLSLSWLGGTGIHTNLHKAVLSIFSIPRYSMGFYSIPRDSMDCPFKIPKTSRVSISLFYQVPWQSMNSTASLRDSWIFHEVL